MPHAHDSLLTRPLRAATALVLRAPRTVLLLAVIATLVSLGVTAFGLRYHTSRLDLLNPKSSYNQRWLEYLSEFGECDDVVVVVEGTDPRRVIAALDDVAASVASEKTFFQSVLCTIDLSRLRSKGLHYLPVEQLRRAEEFLHQYDGVLHGNWSSLDLSQLIGGVCDRLTLAGGPRLHASAEESRLRAAAELSGLTNSLTSVLQPSPKYCSPWPKTNSDHALPAQQTSQHIVADNGRLGFALLRIRSGEDQFAHGSEALDRLRELLNRHRKRHPHVSLGVTGLPVLENDEMRASQSDMVVAGLLSLLGASLLFMAGFGSVRYPLMTVAALTFAMAWSFAYATVAVGHLNILSVAFGAILIGLGIDFGIHYVARYLQLRSAQQDCDTALRETAGGIGPGIVTGGLTTALAFFTTQLTDFTGISELGVIAGGGIILCILAALIVLPAMIRLWDRPETQWTPPVPLAFGRVQGPAQRFPRLMLVLGCGVTIALAIGATRLRYDHNLLNLQPIGLESVDLERSLLERSDKSVWYAVSLAESRDGLRQLKARYDQLDTVQRTEEIVSLLADESPEKCRIIKRIHQRLPLLPDRPPLIPPPRDDALTWQLQRAVTLLRLSGSAFEPVASQLDTVLKQLQQASNAERARRIARLQQQLAADLLGRLRELRDASDPEPPLLEDLAPGLVSRFVGKRQRHLLKIYARGDIWNMTSLQQFVSDVESVNPRVTGHPIQAYYASRQMQLSYVHAAIYSLLAVAIVLMLDFRSIRYTLLAMLPMALGLVQMFGVLGMLDIPLNPANMIVLPLILGIGIDDGVHVVHDFRRRTSSSYRLANSTATAIVLTSATTMVGFGSLIFAKHQGLRSLGQVLTIGVFCCLVSSLLLLPALLRLCHIAGSETGADKAELADGEAMSPDADSHEDAAAGDAPAAARRFLPFAEAEPPAQRRRAA